MDTTALFSLLRKRTRANASKIDALIEKKTLIDKTVLALDSSGFTRKTNEYGIIHFLAVMTECFDQLHPIIKKRKGQLVSEGADNMLVVFDKPLDAVAAAVDMQRLMTRRNKRVAERDSFSVCIGIHCGKLLRLKDGVYGSTVNVAAKIGEDLAGRDEIVVSQAVVEAVGKKFRLEYSRSTTLGGRTHELHLVRF
jgi:adenylate cyclase